MESEIVRKLRKEILTMQGIQPTVHGQAVNTGLGAVNEAFPYGAFPVGVHEFVSNSPECAAATSGFMAGLIGKIIRPDDVCLWIGSERILFPPGLSFFGIKPDQVIFVDSRKQRDVAWMIEQALRCEVLGMVIGELADLDPGQFRRLQLTVEQSRINCFLHRYQPRAAVAIASVCRWSIRPLSSSGDNGFPGVGFPTWDVTLEKVRNGQPGSWQMQWVEDHFQMVSPRRSGSSQTTTKLLQTPARFQTASWVSKTAT